MGSSLILGFLMSTAGARPPAPVDDRVGFGSTLTFTTEIDFGRTRQQTFCDGRPAGPLAKLSWRTCCDLFVRGVAHDASVRWAPGPRTVTWTNWNFTKIVVDGTTGSGIRCTPNAVDERTLRKAFGAHLEIERVPPADPRTRRGSVTL